MEQLELKSTQKGFFSEYLLSAIGFVALLLLAFWLSDYINSVYDELGVSSFTEFDALSINLTKTYEFLVPLSYGGMYLSYITDGFIALTNLFTAFYRSKEVNTFSRDKNGYWNNILRHTPTFPFGKTTQHAAFDRIIGISVEQPGLTSWFDTGTLKVSTIVFTNADSKEKLWTIPAVKEPYQLKEEIEKSMRGHDGVLVKVLSQS